MSDASLKNCSRCKTVAYCNTTCQKADWPAHKLVCNKQAGGTDEAIPCVKIHGGPGRYSRTTLKPTHLIFNSNPLPISTKIGFPLVMSRVIDRLPRGQETDNMHATWLNIDPVSGFAPEYWQGGIGDVIVAKADKSALTPDELREVVDYVSVILDAFGEGETPLEMYKRSRLDQFMGR
jgi:hypothetical protein